MTDHSQMKLGARPHVHDERVLPMARYVRTDALTWPSSCDHAAPASAYPMRLNDQIGDCVIADLANYCVTAHYRSTGQLLDITDDQVLALYELESGYRPGEPATDVGCNAAQVFADFASVGAFGRICRAAMGVNDMVLPAIYLFGAASLQVALPLTAQTQSTWDIAEGQPLTGDWAPGSWGLHEVLAVRYDADGVDVVTWGQIKRVTHRWLAVYLQQAYALVADDLFGADGKSPEGFDAAALLADLQQVAA